MNRFLASTAMFTLFSAALMTPVLADDAAAPAPSATAQPKTMKDALNEQIQDAQVLRQQGKFPEAAKALGQIMLVAPDDVRVMAEYGKTLTQMGRSNEAVAFLTRAVQMQANDWTVYSALGVAYDQLDKRTEAREAYDRALALKPGEPSVLNNYAVSRMLAGDYAGAQKMLMQVQASGANDPRVAGNLAKLAELEASKAPAKAEPVVTAAAPHANVSAAHAPVTTAALAPPKAEGGVMMQKVPTDPLAGPVGKDRTAHATPPAPPAPVAVASTPPKAAPSTATHAPAALAVAAKTPTAIAAAQPVVAGKVMMEKVPVDPLAGPVATRTAAQTPKKPAPKAAHVETAAAKPKDAKPAEAPKTVMAKASTTLSAAPALRTASDTN
ncbi:MAG TPA: tetratricopeptide repeat protein [Rhizomicrobium sp.]